MIVLDEPYVSRYLVDTIVTMDLPVLRNATSVRMNTDGRMRLVDGAEVVRCVHEGDCRMYTNSEHAIGWIAEHLGETDLAKTIALFKDKAAFRKLISGLYPTFFFRSVPFGELDMLDVALLPKPFVIKPAVGFFSAGVHVVRTDEEWTDVLDAIKTGMEDIAAGYPPEVCDAGTFIIEEYIEGTELAVDAYFNAQGEPVVLNILAHLFSSVDDVDDRVYLTSRKIVAEQLAPVTHLLRRIQALMGITNFPLHIELRVNDDGKVVPIEVNPLRFAGWCTTDIAEYAWGINVYRFYFEGMVPDWDRLLQEVGDDVYALLVVQPPAGTVPETIAGFDYETFVAGFSEPLELRPVEYPRYPVFGFLFTRMKGGVLSEAEAYLRSDMQDVIRFRER
ncbi:hypothetical protein AZH53_11010 [Methanomicrobiaceae archaeon CYW5]|uniref:ATP-grasp domain-containing protein n=1 Tax=Methanovulcanius yangii TaxID=1789227 RepID=UPI0029CA8559|nr:ATP-grasp domain-containing protein [Methanovulcanius yangii]MBT8506845.1 hypothetical protein [Methanovulcanius yangii]MBT8508932.1 hypothetical protein [Methanovulcanius yangii]